MQVEIPEGIEVQVEIPEGMTLGEIFRRRRLGKGFSQVEMADQLEVSRWTLRNLENDRVKPQPGTLRKVSEFLELPIYEVMKLAYGEDNVL